MENHLKPHFSQISKNDEIELPTIVRRINEFIDKKMEKELDDIDEFELGIEIDNNEAMKYKITNDLVLDFVEKNNDKYEYIILKNSVRKIAD